jgi:tRNA pseudouridine65 synthase
MEAEDDIYIKNPINSKIIAGIICQLIIACHTFARLVFAKLNHCHFGVLHQVLKGTPFLLSIKYQDADIIVVHKPSGLLVHRSDIDKHETMFLLQLLRDQIQQQVFPVHRLDKPTSGLMVLALNKDSARTLSQSFAQRTTFKQYTAIVRGYTQAQIIDYPLKEMFDKMTDTQSSKDKPAKDAITRVEVLSTAEVQQPVGRYNSARYSAVRLSPDTGRKHQLRRHMSHIRHPIIGDTSHGDGKQNQFARSHLNVNRLALVATKLSIHHPISNELMTFTTQIDEDLQAAFSIFDSKMIANDD